VFVPNVTAGVPAIVFEALAPVPLEFIPATDILCERVPVKLVNVAVVADVPFLGYTKPPVSVSAAPDTDLNASTLYVVAPVAVQLAVKPVAVIELKVMVGVPGTATVAVPVVEPVPLNAVALAAVIVTVELVPAESPDTVKL
jgi:hypothetical protein